MRDPLDLAVLAVQPANLTCRPLEGGKPMTVRLRDRRMLREVVPGEIVTLRQVEEMGRSLLADFAGVRLDVEALGLTPLGRVDGGPWSPSDEYWGEPDERLPAFLLPILSAGPRPSFEMQQVLPGSDDSLDGPDPILDSIELARTGDLRRARAPLHRCLVADLRCLDAHAHLGNLEFELDPARALRHYRAGAAIGELTVPADSPWVLPWGMVDNRPFLRCLHGVGIALWKLGQPEAAAEMMERILWLCPSDNLGERLLLEAIRRGQPWHEDP